MDSRDAIYQPCKLTSFEEHYLESKFIIHDRAAEHTSGYPRNKLNNIDYQFKSYSFCRSLSNSAYMDDLKAIRNLSYI